MPTSSTSKLAKELGYIWKGLKSGGAFTGAWEDLTHNKMMRGQGKWNDIEKAKKKKDEQKKKTTPWTSFGKKNAEDVQTHLRERNKALYQ